jgi:hypothetical protein
MGLEGRNDGLDDAATCNPVPPLSIGECPQLTIRSPLSSGDSQSQGERGYNLCRDAVPTLPQGN